MDQDNISDGQIPKIIHHVWLGDEAPSPFLRQCRDSLKRLHPDWQFMLTTEDAFLAKATPAEEGDLWGEWIPALWHHPALVDLRKSLNFECFYERCLQYRGRHHPRAIAADFVRTCVLYCWGGIYVDWDIYALQPFDRFRSDDIVFAKIRDSLVGEEVIGCRPEDPRIRDILIRYMTTQNPEGGVCCLNLSGFCDENNIFAYPSEYFIPHRRVEAEDEQARYRFTSNTHAIHCWKEGTYDTKRLEAIGVELRGYEQVKRSDSHSPCGCTRSKG